MTNKKIISLLGLLIILILGFFYFQNKTENQERKNELIKFVKEYNLTLEKDLDEDLDEEDKNVPLENFQEKEGEINVSVEKNNSLEILPYTKPLPEMPDEEENNSTLLGIDSNENGVRDDVEIAIVKEFGNNEEATEFMLAAFRYKQLVMELSEYEVNQDAFIYLSNYYGGLYSCANYSFDENNNISTKDFFMNKISSIVNIHLNNTERKKAQKRTMAGLSSGGAMSGAWHSHCLQYQKQSIIDMNEDVNSFSLQMIADRGL